MVINITKYALRGGEVQSRFTGGGCNTPPTSFYAQTFGVEKIEVDIYEAKTELLATSDFQGQNAIDVSSLGPNADAGLPGREGIFSKASYQMKPLRTSDGDIVFSATEEHVAEYIDDEGVLGL